MGKREQEKRDWTHLGTAIPQKCVSTTPEAPIVLLSQTGVAALVHLTPARINQLYHEGRMPLPVGLIDERKPVWSPNQFGALAMRETSSLAPADAVDEPS
jgi:hypothetical protein